MTWLEKEALWGINSVNTVFCVWCAKTNLDFGRVIFFSFISFNLLFALLLCFFALDWCKDVFVFACVRFIA